MANFDDMKFAVEALSGGKNTVILDDRGMPSIMVALPKMLSSELDAAFTQTTNPAWVLNGAEKKTVYLSKFQNVVIGDRAYSLPMKDPRANITFDAALAACRNKGEGWGLTPFALWSAVALWSKKNGTMPRGNNNYGRDVNYTHEKGTPTYYESGKVARIATGSGPATWNHNWLPDGIADMNGNVWEWCAGMRLMDGEIQIIPYANCMDPACDMGANSAAWRAILEDGTLVQPGTSGTLKYDYAGGKITLAKALTTQADEGRSTTFETLGSAITTVPQIIKELALFPNGTGYEGDNFYMNNTGERLPFRGGGWYHGASAGVFYSGLNGPRSDSGSSLGFRSAFYGDL